MRCAIRASICGADGWTEMEEFGTAKRRWFERFLELPHGILSHDTFGDVVARIDPRHLTLNMLKHETTYKRSMKGKRLQAGWDESYLEKVLKS